jgi:hypothetical protein
VLKVFTKCPLVLLEKVGWRLRRALETKESEMKNGLVEYAAGV